MSLLIHCHAGHITESWHVSSECFKWITSAGNKCQREACLVAMEMNHETTQNCQTSQQKPPCQIHAKFMVKWTQVFTGTFLPAVGSWYSFLAFHKNMQTITAYNTSREGSTRKESPNYVTRGFSDEGNTLIKSEEDSMRNYQKYI